MAHQALDEWLEGLKPLFEPADPPTLMDLSAQLMRSRGSLFGACLEALAEHLHGDYQDQQHVDCPGWIVLGNIIIKPGREQGHLPAIGSFYKASHRRSPAAIHMPNVT